MYLINIFIFKLIKRKTTRSQAHLWAETLAKVFRAKNLIVTEGCSSITIAVTQQQLQQKSPCNPQ